MKLSMIAEAGNTPILSNAQALQDIVTYLKQNVKQYPKEHKDFMAFLKKPTIRSWQNTKYIVKNLLAVDDPTIKDRKVKWASLITNNPDAVVSSSVYDIDPTVAAGTPASRYAISGAKRKDLKKLLGPSGWITKFAAQAETMTPSQIAADQRNTNRYANILKATLPALAGAGYRPNRPVF